MNSCCETFICLKAEDAFAKQNKVDYSTSRPTADRGPVTYMHKPYQSDKFHIQKGFMINEIVVT